MIVYPAIDLLGGRCVRLRQGDYAQVTAYDDDPLVAARRWRDQGATWLHIVDLDGARAGRPVNLRVIERIAGDVGLPLRLGGGLRSPDDVAAAFAAGASRVALSALALEPTRLATLIARWGDRIEVALDRRGNVVALDGWRATASLSPRQWARQAAQAGARTLLVTDVTRDGALGGANPALVAQTRADAEDASIAVIIAGGVTTVDDIAALRRAGADGVVIGRALYDGRLALADALAAADAPISAPGETAPCS